jgi:hypothetical protein
MSHERFERLLLADAPLIAGDQETLRQHLAVCRSCSELRERWSGLEPLLFSAPMRAPRPGFGNRWAARQEMEAAQGRRRGAWQLFAWTSIGATGMAAALGFVLLQAPAFLPTVLAGFLEQALRLWLWSRAAGELASAVASNVPAPAVAAAMIAGAGLFAGVGLFATLGVFGIIRFSFQGVRA